VNYYASSLASWQSVGLLLATSLEDARSTSVPAATVSNGSAKSLTSGSSNRGALPGGRDSTQQGRHLQAGAAQRKQPYNYVLAATNATLAGHLLQQGSVDGPTPCIIYLDSNATLSKPPVPAEGIPMARPMAVVGLASKNTSIDFYMQVRTRASAHHDGSGSSHASHLRVVGVKDGRRAVSPHQPTAWT
jgi:hypothetical protein